MTGEEFQQIAERLYGESWREEMAQALGLHHITIWRYARKARIPQHITLAVQRLVDEG